MKQLFVGLSLGMLGVCLFIQTQARSLSPQSQVEEAEHQAAAAELKSKRAAKITSKSQDHKQAASEDQPWGESSPLRSETLSFAEAFYAGLDNLPVLESREATLENDTLRYRDELLYKADYRYPSLIRRTYVRGSGQGSSGEKQLREVQVADQFLIQIKAGQEGTLDKSLLPAALQTSVRALKQISEQSYMVQFTFKDLSEREELRKDFAALPSVVGVFNDRFAFSTATLPRDPYLPQIWSFANDGVNRAGTTNLYVQGVDAKVTAAWDYASDCSKIPIAVLDTGVDYEHPDLKANILMSEGRSFVSGVTDFRDDQYHGTHVTGIIAAVGNNDVGISGVCWKAQIIPIKVMDAQGAGTLSEVVSGFNYAVRSRAKIANASLAFGPLPPQTLSPDEPLLVVTREFARQGKLLVTASGNDGINIDTALVLPIQIDSDAIVGVGALAPTGMLAAFSNYGTTVDIAAPGAEILSTVPTTRLFPAARLLRSNGATVAGYGYLDGTSMASPLVAGAIALFWSQVPELPAAEVKRLLLGEAQVSELDLKLPGNKLLEAAKLSAGTRFRFDVETSSEGSQLEAGRTMSITIKITESGFFKPVQFEVVSQGTVLASSTNVTAPLSFQVPREADLSLVARVKDSAGRSFESTPLLRAVGGIFLDFSKISIPKDGNILCTLIESKKDGKELLHEVNVASRKFCQKFCDIVKPLLEAENKTIECGIDLPI